MLIDGWCDGLIDMDDGRIGDMDRRLVPSMVSSGRHGQSRLAPPKVPPRPLVMSDKPWEGDYEITAGVRCLSCAKGGALSRTAEPQKNEGCQDHGG